MYPTMEDFVRACSGKEQQPEYAAQPTQQTITRTTVEMLVEYARLQNPQGQCAPLPTTDCFLDFLDFEKWPNEAILA